MVLIFTQKIGFPLVSEDDLQLFYKKHLALFNFVHMYSVLSILTLFTRRMDGYREFEMLKIKLETMTLKNLEQSKYRIQFNDGVRRISAEI
jgi:hypothetical protein